MRAPLLLSGLLLLWVAVGPAPAVAPAGALCLTALDVGQGDSLLLRFPGGEAWLVDGGGVPGSRYDVGEARVVPALRKKGVDRLDLVVVTHGDADHAGGIAAVLEQLEVGALLLPRERRQGNAERMLQGLAQERGVPVRFASSSHELPTLGGGARARLLHPPVGWDGVGESNDGSVVLRLGFGAVRMLLTGDLEEAGESALLASGEDVAAEVLKLGHHGSRTSTSPAFLDRVGPQVAVASAGRDNRYGFPHALVTERLGERAIPLWWTGRHGELKVCSDGLDLTVSGGPDGERGVLHARSAGEVASAAEAAESRRVDTRRGEGAVQRASGPARGSRREKVASPSSRRSSRAKKGARAPKKTPRKRAKEPPTPAPPELLDDREWRRSRKARQKPRAPWASR